MLRYVIDNPIMEFGVKYNDFSSLFGVLRVIFNACLINEGTFLLIDLFQHNTVSLSQSKGHKDKKNGSSYEYEPNYSYPAKHLRDKT